MKSKKIPSREDQIKLIQKKLADNPPARDFVALTRTLGLLTGAIKTYGRKSDQTQPDQKQEQPEPLPSWWSDSWARVFIAERACGSCRAGRWARELDQFEAEWAKREGFSSVEELREALRREDAEFKAQHSAEERLAMARAQPFSVCSASWTPDDSPVGVMFSARFGEDATLFRLAAQLEKAQPWDKRRPQL